MTVAIGRMKFKSFSVKYVTACPFRPARPVRPVYQDLMDYLITENRIVEIKTPWKNCIFFRETVNVKYF